MECRSGVLGTMGHHVKGVQIGTFNFAKKQICGLQTGVFNTATKSNGLQIGLCNFSKKLKGIQIGLWNKSDRRSLPFFNWGF
ncbi:LA_2272 family surface repeat-containing protein [Bacteroides salyersiae]|uniref:LA_2272 family surface repeat-containing protein n=1 Tax=Bacteroides salyersiae TaxID=291644 RepID=UPI00374CFDF4